MTAPATPEPIAAAELPSAALLEKIGQGACIVHRDGRLVWANPKLRSYPPDVIESVRQACTELCNEFCADPARTAVQPSRRRNITFGHDYYFDVTASPLTGPNQAIEEVIALVWDVTANRKLQDRINAIDGAGADLVGLDVTALASMDVGERLQILEDKIIRHSRELMHFDHFAVRVLDPRTQRLETVLAGGLSEEAKAIDLYALSEGNGISGYVAATGRSYICPDVSKDPRYIAGLEGARSSLTAPLRLHDRVVGILNVESDQVAAFNEDDRQIAEIFGHYIAIALHILQLLAVERNTTTGQVATDVETELAQPLNDIVAEATNIMEDYAGQDQLRQRLRGIIDIVDRAKRAIHAVTHPAGISGLAREALLADPLLDGKRILVADDEDVIRETIADVLTKGGALTVMARDGEEAVAMIRSQHFDLVLSDIKMPYKNGYEVFAAVRQANVHCPVVLITGFGYDPHHSIVRANKEGLAGVLYKPFKVEQMLDLVRQGLGARAG